MKKGVCRVRQAITQGERGKKMLGTNEKRTNLRGNTNKHCNIFGRKSEIQGLTEHNNKMKGKCGE